MIRKLPVSLFIVVKLLFLLLVVDSFTTKRTYPLCLTTGRNGRMFDTSRTTQIVLQSSTSDAAAAASSSSSSSSLIVPPRLGTLYDVPVSNNGARCRIILYKKGITSDEVRIQPPSVLGGLTSDTYRACNPQCKMPLFIRTTNDDHDASTLVTNIAESDTIARYLLHEYQHIQPSFQIHNVLSNMIVRIHDMYLQPIQGCLYKAKPPFGMYNTRKDAIQEFVKQLHIIEDLMVSTNSNENTSYYLCGGNEVSLADATLYPTMVFASYMLPKFDEKVPSKLQLWYDTITQYDTDFAKVRHEMLETIVNVWENTNHRWDNILGAGWRDTIEPRTIFDSIIEGTIPAKIIEQPDDTVLAFADINPIAPAHVLIIPKDRSGLTRISNATNEHTEILGRLLVAAAYISRRNDYGFGDGCRIVINDGPDGGQEVMHLHVHVIGGRSMSWPPG